MPPNAGTAATAASASDGHYVRIAGVTKKFGAFTAVDSVSPRHPARRDLLSAGRLRIG